MEEQKEKRTINPLFVLFAGCLFGFGYFITTFITFMMAFLHPTKEVIVGVDKYGEANIEFFMMFFMMDFLIICLVYGYIHLKKRR